MKPHPVWCQSSARGQPLSGPALPPPAPRGRSRRAAGIPAPASLPSLPPRTGTAHGPRGRGLACEGARGRRESASSDSSFSPRAEEGPALPFGARGLPRVPACICVPHLAGAAAGCFPLRQGRCRTEGRHPPMNRSGGQGRLKAGE